jgi:hypothetical protein
MSLLNNQSQADVNKYVEQHKARINAFYKRTLMEFRRLGQDVWANRQYTPQEVIAAYGTSAVELFQLSGAMQTLLEHVTGQSVPVMPEGWTYEAHADGSITLTPPAEPEAPAEEPQPE